MSVTAKKIDPDKKVKEGWIRSTMMIEALAVNRDAVKSALEKHVASMEGVKTNHIYKKEFGEPREVEKPLPNVEKAYSAVVELEMVSKNFETLLSMVMAFGPSSVELLEPKKLELDIGEAQGILVLAADIIHRFAGLSIGGIHIRT
jgi:hypothetical protein